MINKLMPWTNNQNFIKETKEKTIFDVVVKAVL
jgi:hypothetical protein